MKPLYLILSTLLLMVCTMGFGSCSKDNVEEVDNVAKNVCFKVEVRTGGYGAETRAAGPSEDDGTLADDENEKAVYNATLFIYQNDKGINGAADSIKCVMWPTNEIMLAPLSLKTKAQPSSSTPTTVIVKI